MYHIRSILDESACSSVLLNSMLRVLRDAREPGRFASSSGSSSGSSSKTSRPWSEPLAEPLAEGDSSRTGAEGVDGWEIWF